MAVLDTAGMSGVNAILRAAILQGIKKDMWKWWEDHREDEVVTFGFLFIRKTFRVKDLKFLFVLLFGDKPEVIQP